MKKWITALLLLILAPSTYAAYSEVQEIAKTCNAMSEIGEGIMLLRQHGHTKEEVRRKGPPNNLAYQLIDAAFEIPMAKSPNQISTAMASFRGDVYLSCIKELTKQ